MSGMRLPLTIVNYGKDAVLLDSKGAIVAEHVPWRCVHVVKTAVNSHHRLIAALEAARDIFKDTLEWGAIVHIDKPTISIGNVIDAALADAKEDKP